MKRYAIMLGALFIALAANARSEAEYDTITVNPPSIHKVVTDETVNSKGRKVTKYYFLIDNELIRTSRPVVEAYNLCQKHGVDLALVKVINRQTKHKRIILN